VSDTTNPGFSLRAAMRFNAKHAGKYAIPEELRLHLADLRGSEAFALAVIELQRVLFPETPHEWDGKYGRGTATEAAREYSYVDDSERHFLRAGIRIPLQGAATRATRLVTWEQDGGLGLHMSGHRARKGEIACVVWHWGGINPEHCRRTLANRNLSSHFGVGRGVNFQWLDLARTAHHAGWINGIAVGVDLCQQPETKWADHYGDLATIDNPSSPRRGPRKVLDLHPEMELAAAELMVDLSAALGIPLEIPGDDALKSKAALRAFRGHVGHHHVSKMKWDPAPYLRGIHARALEIAR